MNKTIKLASNFKIAATEYASQGNAILGIRDSGKTYTAMKAAEELLDAGVPIIVYDPVGVWKNLRVGTGKHKGYPVIVAGGDDSADINLTPDNAVQIVRAAMKAGISIIIDLYSPSLANKSKWIKIVQETIDVLMYENRDYGLRHIFIEEASEFIPQRVQPQQGKVYSSIERIARMGRNSSLGITIINQRAEEVNKAILELCALVFLHKQVGKNSLLSIKKWLEIRDYKYSTRLMNDMPRLQQGECFIIGVETSGGMILKSKILPKHTYHPSPEKGVPAKAVQSTVNISEFIKKLNAKLSEKSLDDKKKEQSKNHLSGVAIVAGMAKQELTSYNERLQIIKEKDKAIVLLEKSNADYKKQLDIAVEEIKDLTEKNTILVKLGLQIRESLTFLSVTKNNSKVKQPADVKINISQYDAKKSNDVSIDYAVKQGGNMSAIKKMAKGVAMHPKGISKSKLAVLCGMSPTSGTYGVYYRKLRSDGIINDNGGLFTPTIFCFEFTANLPDLPGSTNDLLAVWHNILGLESGLTRILKSVANKRWEWVSINDVAEDAGMVVGSGTFGVYYRKLRKQGLIDIKKGAFKLSENLSF